LPKSLQNKRILNSYPYVIRQVFSGLKENKAGIYFISQGRVTPFTEVSEKVKPLLKEFKELFIMSYQKDYCL